MMNKILFIYVFSAVFQTTLYAENIHPQDNANSSPAGKTTTLPDGSSRYNLDGKQSRDGRYGSSYSTGSVDNRNLSKEQTSSDRQRKYQERVNSNAANPGGIGVLIVVDE